MLKASLAERAIAALQELPLPVNFTPEGPKHIRTKGELWDWAQSYAPVL